MLEDSYSCHDRLWRGGEASGCVLVSYRHISAAKQTLQAQLLETALIYSLNTSPGRWGSADPGVAGLDWSPHCGLGTDLLLGTPPPRQKGQHLPGESSQ